ncbi:MAG: hypothetical protein IPH94_19490 [Saprospiraceae bacterium]|nr:hypothetical protein [Saprospiraceae bacterium]
MLFIFDSLSQNVGIGTTNPQSKLHINGNQKIDSLYTLEFGSGFVKESNAGKIGYKTFSTIGLDIVGAGLTGTDRKIFFFGEGGSTFNGNVAINNSGKMLIGLNTPISTYAGSLLQIKSSTHESQILLEGANGGSNYNNISLRDLSGNSWLINHKSAASTNHQLSFDYYNSSTNTYMQYGLKLTAEGRIGIGYDWNETPPATAKASIKGGDIFINDANKGVILKAPNGTCWRITVSNTGTIISTSVSCP